jgi:hypothetical protein
VERNKYTTECFFCHRIWGACQCPEVRPGFLWNEYLITEPNLDETSRQFVDPEVYYGEAYLKWKAERHPGLGMERFPASLKEIDWRQVIALLEREVFRLENMWDLAVNRDPRVAEEFNEKILSVRDIISDLERQLVFCR